MVTYLLITIIFVLIWKWLLIFVILPFQALFNRCKHSDKRFVMLLAGPYYLWEKLFRGGWSHYMIFQVAYIPSNHIRLAIYKLLGCRMGKGNAIHFGTELRGIENIQLGEAVRKPKVR